MRGVFAELYGWRTKEPAELDSLQVSDDAFHIQYQIQHMMKAKFEDGAGSAANKTHMMALRDSQLRLTLDPKVALLQPHRIDENIN